MPLRTVLEGVDETLQEMYLAAECRYQEGANLLKQGAWDGGIYLLGYSAEMLLKLAYCRLDASVRMGDFVSGRLVVAERHWQKIYAGSHFGRRFDLHDLVVLLLSIEDERFLVGKPPFTTSEARSINNHVLMIYDNWWVSMRYRGGYALQQEAEMVKEGVEWLRKNHNILWR